MIMNFTKIMAFMLALLAAAVIMLALHVNRLQRKLDEIADAAAAVLGEAADG